MMCLVAMMAAGTSLKAQEVTITISPGWNWISYPNAVSMDIDEALGDFEPVQGDRLKSMDSSTEYDSEWGWEGELETLVPGQGYMYYSARTVAISFAFVRASSSTVTTTSPTDITTNSATCGGNVTSSNGDYVFVILKGICWGTNPNPTFNDNYIEAGNGLGSFTVSMTGLTPNTTFYARAFAVTSTGTFYGGEMSFTTDHEYVDLGLPSGLLWATCNVGADNPEDYGDYFAWGETQPKDTYNWSTYQYCNGGYNTLTKYCNNSSCGYNGFTDNLTTLLPEDDAATANWGSDWRMPTKEEWQELYSNTTVTWTTQNGVNGRLFTTSNGNCLFLPAAGCRSNSSLYNAGSYGYYWSSSLYTGDPVSAWYFYFDSDYYYMNGSYRYYGLSVRPVCSSRQN